jgi:uncharacterized protein YkwD
VQLKQKKENVVIEKSIKLGATLLTFAALSACGGGGGGGNTTPAAASVGVVAAPVVVSTASTIVATAPTPNYAGGSEELSAFNKLNAERTSCGFGALAQNALLDKAAKAHADYQLVNFHTGHFETVGIQAFTGVAAADRIIAAGYSTLNSFAATDEISDLIGTNVKTAMGGKAIRGLLNAPYHEAGLMSGFRDVGLSLRNATDAGSTFGPRVILQVNPAYKNIDGPQLIAANEIKTYPCDNSVDIEPILQDETPNPVPGRNLGSSPLGSSVYVAVRDGNTITITSATMTNLTSGVPLALRPAITAVNDPNKVNGVSYLKSNQAFISADAPLSANTKHQVTVTGTNNGAAFSRNFIFTTGLAS